MKNFKITSLTSWHEVQLGECYEFPVVANARKLRLRLNTTDKVVVFASNDPDMKGDAILLDCLTLWTSNVLLRHGPEEFDAHQHKLLAALSAPARPVVIVSNEVGMGIVPETPLGRDFRDLTGSLNQRVAALADHVVFMIAGLPLTLKDQDGRFRAACVRIS